MKKLLLSLLLILSGLICLSQTQIIKEIIVYTETTGWDHGTKSKCTDLYGEIADTMSLYDPVHDYRVTQDDNGSLFTISDLNPDSVFAVIFCNTSGNSGLSASQRSAFEAYIQGGGNYVGIHAATDTYRHSSANGSKTGTWDWYAENVAGKSVQNSPNHTSSSHVDTNYVFVSPYASGLLPGAISLPSIIIKKEEYYYWENGYESPDFTSIMDVGDTGGNSYDDPRSTARFKVTPWGGCATSTSWGHSGDNYTKTDPGEQGHWFKILLTNFMINPCQQVFNIRIDPQIIPGPEPVFLIAPEDLPPLGLRQYSVYTLEGKLVQFGEIDERGYIPVVTDPGVYAYKFHGRFFLSGIK